MLNIHINKNKLWQHSLTFSVQELTTISHHIFSYQFTNSSSKLKLFSLPLKGNLPLGRLPPPLPSQRKEGIPQAMLCETVTLLVPFNLLNCSLGFFPFPLNFQKLLQTVQ